MTFDYYYGQQADQFNFIRVPKKMMKDPLFANLSSTAKLLYGLLLDRMNLSMKNKWLDENQRVYIIYQISEIMDDFNFSKRTAIKYLNELEDFGLIEKVKRGFGLPSLIYVKSFLTDSEENTTDSEENTDENITENNEEQSENSQNNHRGVKSCTSRSADFCTSKGEDFCTSGGVELYPSRGADFTPLNNNTKFNNTKHSNTNLSNLINQGEIRWDSDMSTFRKYETLIKENIEYDALMERYPYISDTINGIVDLILEICISEKEKIIISGDTYPKELVKSKFLKLDFSHIQYVLDCLNKNTTQVRNIKKYVLAALFNAPTTIDVFYNAQVNHDMPQLAKKIIDTKNI